MEVQENMKVTQIATLNIKEIHEVRVSEGPNKNFTVDFFFVSLFFLLLLFSLLPLLLLRNWRY